MTRENSIKVFDQKHVRTHWNEDEENKKVAQQGGNVAQVAKKELEAKTGKKVVTALNAKAVLKENKKLPGESDTKD